MLNKLLKYECKAMGRLLLPLFAGLLIVSLILGASLSLSVEMFPFLRALLGVIYGGLLMAVFVTVLILIVQRFYKNLLGDEGYLMLTIPVSTGKHIMNKVISSVIWTMLAFIVGLGSIFIVTTCLAGVGNTLNGIGEFFSEASYYLGGNFIWIILILVCFIIIATASGVLKIYASIVIGHQLNRHRKLGSLVSYLLLGVMEMIMIQGLMKVFISITGRIELMGSMAMMEVDSMAMFYQTIGFLSVMILITGILYYTITYTLMKEKINLD